MSFQSANFFQHSCAGCGSFPASQLVPRAKPRGGRFPPILNTSPDSRGIQTMAVHTTAVSPTYRELTAAQSMQPPGGAAVVSAGHRRGSRDASAPLGPRGEVQSLATIESGDLSRNVADKHKAISQRPAVHRNNRSHAWDLFEHHARHALPSVISTSAQQEADLKAAEEELAARVEQIPFFRIGPRRPASSELRVDPAPRFPVLFFTSH